MTFVWNHVVEEIQGDDIKVNNLRIKDTQTGEVSDYPVDAVFIYVGLDPITEPFKSLGVTNEEGWIPTNEKMETSVRCICDRRCT